MEKETNGVQAASPSQNQKSKYGEVNYIKQLNAFWHKSQHEGNLKPTAIDVYTTLLQINNRSGWKPVFKAVFGEVLSMTGISNSKTYYNALDCLVDNGYINYTPGHATRRFLQFLDCQYFNHREVDKGLY